MDFNKITYRNAVGFSSYYNSSTNNYFYMSALYLSYPSNSQFKNGYIINDGCLVILRKGKILGNPFLYLAMPPISRDMNIDKERGLILSYKAKGVNCKMSEEDALKYGFDDMIPNKNNIEYIYSANEYKKLSGSKFAKIRNKINKLKKDLTIRSINVNHIKHSLIKFTNKCL